jgi:hypothetical protein
VSWLLHTHGLLALAALYAGYRVRKAIMAAPGSSLRGGWRAWAAALLAGVAALFASGIALYARYRAPGGVRSWLLDRHPNWHLIWFEWKEHLGFFALAIAAGLYLAALRSSGPGTRALALPLLLTLLAALLLTATVGGFLSFFLRAVT